jgi:hypothetical protein
MLRFNFSEMQTHRVGLSEQSMSQIEQCCLICARDAVHTVSLRQFLVSFCRRIVSSE